jgi:hypothetical protein
MKVRSVFAAVVAVGLVFAAGTLAAADAKKKAKSARATGAPGAAGVVSSAKGAAITPRAIDDNDAQGFYCTFSTPNVHHLGTVPAGTGIIIDFDSDDTSDPIAILTTVKMDGVDVGAEIAGSDDEGGDLNPRFALRRPYTATYILTVASADDDEACYGFRMRWVP